MRLFIVGICMVLAFNLIESSPEDSYEPETFSEAIPTIKKPKTIESKTKSQDLVEQEEKKENNQDNEISAAKTEKELVSCEPVNITDCEDCGGIDCKQLNLKIKIEVFASILGEEAPNIEILNQMHPSQVERL